MKHPTATVRLKCSICHGDILPDPISGWWRGHNAEPVNDGRCCSECNDRIVLRARLRRIYGLDKT